MQTGNTIYCNSPGGVTGFVTRKYTGPAPTSSDDTSAGTKSVNLSSRQSVSDEGSRNLENRMRLGIKNKWTCFVLHSPFSIFAVEMSGGCVECCCCNRALLWLFFPLLGAFGAKKWVFLPIFWKKSGKCFVVQKKAVHLHSLYDSNGAQITLPL